MKPFVTYLQDYHDFNLIKRVFKHANLDVDYVEVGCGHSELTDNEGYGERFNQYHAVFFIVGEEKSQEVQELISFWKAHFDTQ